MTKVKQLQTIREVVEEVRRRYEGVEQLSATWDKDMRTGCFYDHSVNGVGCAIGCLFTPGQTRRFRENVDIRYLLTHNTRTFHTRISLDIPDEELYLLQAAHDKAVSTDEFRAALDNYLATGAWPDYVSEPYRAEAKFRGEVLKAYQETGQIPL